MDRQQRDEIRDFATATLVAAGVRHRVPAPLDDVLGAADLVRADNLGDYLEASPSRFERTWRFLSGKVRGFLAAREGIIWVDPEMRDAQRRFTVAHEIGHHVIPWQRAAHIFDCDSDLTPDTKEMFEREANAFASDLLFNVDDFTYDALGGPLSLSTPSALATRYQASLIATSRRFVEEHAAECALIVLGRYTTRSMSKPAARLLYGVQSRSFEDRYGPVMRGLRLPVAWPKDFHSLAMDSYAAITGSGFPLTGGMFTANSGDTFTYEVLAGRPYPFILLVPTRRFLPHRKGRDVRWLRDVDAPAEPVTELVGTTDRAVSAG